VVAESDLLTVLPRHFLDSAGVHDSLVARPLPMEVPPIHIDAMWHVRQDADSAHRWLRDLVQRSAPPFADPGGA